jgi:predicted RecA/RadA family phage recombinase
MKNFVEKGETITLLLIAYALVSGQIVEVGAMSGISAGNYKIGENAVINLCGVYNVPKISGAVTLGQKLYSNAAGSATVTVGTNVFLGYAYTAQAAGDATVQVLLAR